MSRQSKNRKNLERAREFSKLRQGGGKGPSQTRPLHGKVKVKWKEPRTAWWKTKEAANDSQKRKKAA